MLSCGPTVYPQYACDRNPDNSPYGMISAYEATSIPGGSRVCMTVGALRPCPKNNECCKTNFQKVSFGPAIKNTLQHAAC